MRHPRTLWQLILLLVCVASLGLSASTCIIGANHQ